MLYRITSPPDPTSKTCKMVTRRPSEACVTETQSGCVDGAPTVSRDHRTSSHTSMESVELVGVVPIDHQPAGHAVHGSTVEETWQFTLKPGPGYSSPVSPTSDAYMADESDLSRSDGTLAGLSSSHINFAGDALSPDGDVRMCVESDRSEASDGSCTMVVGPSRLLRLNAPWTTTTTTTTPSDETCPFCASTRLLQHHQKLLARLRSICTLAARFCWYNEAAPYASQPTMSFQKVRNTVMPTTRRRMRYLCHPYAMPSLGPSQLPPPLWHRDLVSIEPDMPRHEHTLHRYIFRIADALWNRVRGEVCCSGRAALPSTDVEKDALDRMQSLFRLADCVTRPTHMLRQDACLGHGLGLNGSGGSRRCFRCDHAPNGRIPPAANNNNNTTTPVAALNGTGAANNIGSRRMRPRRGIQGLQRPTVWRSHRRQRPFRAFGRAHDSHVDSMPMPMQMRLLPRQTNHFQPQTQPLLRQPQSPEPYNHPRTPPHHPHPPHTHFDHFDHLISFNQAKNNNNNNNNNLTQADLIQAELRHADFMETQRMQTELMQTELWDEIFAAIAAARELCRLCSYDAGVRAVNDLCKEWQNMMLLGLNIDD
ncbi:MAG: hypothetical protein M1815_000460 [Lichina confinis]|nr:MAG: hypothetical protein M1815_000460 [Lichina confinis]